MLARIAARVSAFAERWIPDAFVFALIATLLTAVLGVLALTRSMRVGRATLMIVDAWGGGVWELLGFTMQMALIIITGFVLATSRPIGALIVRLARVPSTDRGAIAFIAFFALCSSWINWGFSLIFSAMLAKQLARHRPSIDYRAACAASLLGLGSVWAQGLSGSAALQMASGKAMPIEVRAIVAGPANVAPGGIIPLTETIFLWQSLLSVAIEIVVVTLLAWAITPKRGTTAAMLQIELGPELAARDEPAKERPPGERLEHSHWLSCAIVALAIAAIVRALIRGHRAGSIVSAISLDVLNLTFLALGFLLHGTPSRLMRAVRSATPSIWSVVLQFPFYAGISAIVVKSGLHEIVAHAFVGLSTPKTYPALVATYSMVLGVFVPSGGTKWIIEAPYVMSAAHAHHVHLGWMVAVYDLGEALANLIQPFWMLPVLSIFGLRARDVMGFTATVFVVLMPIVLVMVTLLGATLTYPR